MTNKQETFDTAYKTLRTVKIAGMLITKIQNEKMQIKYRKWLRRVFLFFALLVCVLLLNTVFTSRYYSGVALWDSSRHLENKQRGEEIFCVYILTNMTLQTVHIALEPACGCIEAQAACKTLAPLASMTIVLRLRTVDLESGDQNQRVGIVLQSKNWTCKRHLGIQFHLE